MRFIYKPIAKPLGAAAKLCGDASGTGNLSDTAHERQADAGQCSAFFMLTRAE